MIFEPIVHGGDRRVAWKQGSVVIVVALVTLAACGGEKKPSSNTTRSVPDSGVASSASVGSAAGALPAPEPGVPPAGTTGRMTSLGDSIFHGQAAGGMCFTCHGPDAKGTPLAPSLVDHEWLTGNGSFAFIVQRITQGMPTPTAPYPGPMLPMGGHS